MPKKKSPTKPAPTPTPPADVPVLSPAAHCVLTLLDPRDGATAADLAERAGLARSTVTKALSILHETDLAVRQEGGHEGTRRIADRWFAVAGSTDAAPGPAVPERAAVQDPDARPESVDETETPAASGADDDGSPTCADAPAVTAAPDEGAAPITDRSALEPDHIGQPHPVAAASGDDCSEQLTDETGPDGGTTTQAPELVVGPARAEPDEDGGSPVAPGDEQGQDGPSAADREEPVPVASAAPPARLGKGELRGQVEDYLREHADQAWTPTAISKVLNRSAGAINNACVKLSETGTVTVLAGKPVRFQWNVSRNGTAAS